MVKRLRHRPFTAVSGVRFPHRSPFGRLAQLGERLPYKQNVSGSIPLAPTIENQQSSNEGCFFYYAAADESKPFVFIRIKFSYLLLQLTRAIIKAQKVGMCNQFACYTKRKTGSASSRFFIRLTVILQVSVEPFADIVRYYSCHNRYNKGW